MARHRCERVYQRIERVAPSREGTSDEEQEAKSEHHC